MKQTKVFYNVLILLAALLLTACQDQKDIPEVSSPEKNLVLSDYISNQKVKSICEDRYGQIWIGTFRGLNKYDGNQYHQYYCVDDSLGLPDNNITDIYRDSHNRLWVATVNGVCLYQANGNFKRVSINGTNKNIEKSWKTRREESSFSRQQTCINMTKKTTKPSPGSPKCWRRTAIISLAI